MKNKTKYLSGLVLAAGLSANAFAEEPYSFSANVALTSDYVFRGLSQTNEDPAIQGGFDMGHSSGFYAGTWGSNIEFGSQDDAHLELDAYLGFANELASGLSYDIGYAYYMYPGAIEDLNYDFGELYLKLGYNILKFAYYYSPEFFGESGTAHYYNLGVAYELPQGFTLGASVGHSDLETDAADYTDWKIEVGKSMGGFDFSLAYTDTDVDNAPLADGRAVLTVKKSF